MTAHVTTKYEVFAQALFGEEVRAVIIEYEVTKKEIRRFDIVLTKEDEAFNKIN